MAGNVLGSERRAVRCERQWNGSAPPSAPTVCRVTVFGSRWPKSRSMRACLSSWKGKQAPVTGQCGAVAATTWSFTVRSMRGLRLRPHMLCVFGHSSRFFVTRLSLCSCCGPSPTVYGIRPAPLHGPCVDTQKGRPRLRGDAPLKRLRPCGLRKPGAKPEASSASCAYSSSAASSVASAAGASSAAASSVASASAPYGVLTLPPWCTAETRSMARVLSRPT